MRLRLSRPRKLSTWLFLALALMLAPQFIGAAVGISQQQAQINDAREDGRAVATRLGRIAHLQATLDATEDAVLRAPGEAGARRARACAARSRARTPTCWCSTPRGSTATSTRLQALAAGDLDTRASRRRLEAPLDSLRTATARLADETVATHRRREASGERADQRTQLLGILARLRAPR